MLFKYRLTSNFKMVKWLTLYILQQKAPIHQTVTSDGLRCVVVLSSVILIYLPQQKQLVNRLVTLIKKTVVINEGSCHQQIFFDKSLKSWNTGVLAHRPTVFMQCLRYTRQTCHLFFTRRACPTGAVFFLISINVNNN